MKKLTAVVFSGIIISGLLLGACKKNKEELKTPAGSGNLEIRLDTGYMPVNKIDSAIVEWKINGASKTIKLQLSGDTLRAPLQEFSEGNGQLTIQLYTKVKVSNNDLQWEKRWQFQLQHN